MTQVFAISGDIIALSHFTGSVCNLGGSLVNQVNGSVERNSLKRKQYIATKHAELERSNREHDISKWNVILEELKRSSEDESKEQNNSHIIIHQLKVWYRYFYSRIISRNVWGKQG